MNILITGGCGFIGYNAVARFARLGHRVTILDNLSRPCTSLNRECLERQPMVSFVKADVRDRRAVIEVMQSRRFDVVLHLAGQVAVTTSLKDPRNDFETNALGTLNVLEGLRQHLPEAIFLNASTNKVYGKLPGLQTMETPTRYNLADCPNGIAESQPLDFHSPYGCSKGAADQYTIDYARVYGIRTVNFRQSCIYGLQQFGVEDQGWVAWFTIAHELNRPITVYGTGKQVRDLLFVDDLIDCYVQAVERIEQVAGLTFNVGGGPANTLSVIEFFELLENLSGRPVVYHPADFRPGDQLGSVSNNRRAAKRLACALALRASHAIHRLVS